MNNKAVNTMKVFLSVLFGAVMFSSSASAAIFSYISSSDGEPNRATYYFNIDRWDDYAPNVLNECIYRPCYLAINHKHTAAGTPGTSTYPAVDVTNLRTMQQVKQAFTDKYPIPFSGSTKHNGPYLQSNQECVGLFFQSTPGGNGTGYLLNGSLCGIAPPPTGACKINENIPNISFGSISEGELAGQTREVTVSVSCNLTMDVLVIATGVSGTNSRENLRQDGSLYANLTLGNNNTPGESGYRVSVPAGGVNTVKLKATLGTNGRVEPGSFKGAAALILTMP